MPCLCQFEALRTRAEKAESRVKELEALVVRRHEDAMVAHRWFAKKFGEVMNGRDFKVKCEMATRILEEREVAQVSQASDVLVRLKATQCCDPVIDGLLGSAIEEIQRLRQREGQI